MSMHGGKSGTREMEEDESSDDESGSGSKAMWALGGLALAGLVGVTAWIKTRNGRVATAEEPRRHMVSRTFLNRDIRQDQCAICFESLCNCGPVQQDIVQLVCGHIFHSACINSWFLPRTTPTCPECRMPTTDNVKVVNYKCDEKKSEKK